MLSALGNGKSGSEEPKVNLGELVEQARVQWQLAKEYFEFVKEPELVDLAINHLETAERHYNYLLKQMRER